MQLLNIETSGTSHVFKEKIIQFGGGNFLRGFVDWMIDVLNDNSDFGGSVVVVKPTPSGTYKELLDQDGRFHVMTNGLRNGELVSEVHLVKCIRRVIHPYLEWDEYLVSAESATLRFVFSNTTESGIQFKEEDLLGNMPPNEFPGKLTAWLWHRYQFFKGNPSNGCIIIPCELLQDNGVLLKDCILKYASHWGLGPGFEKWIHEHNYFCNTLVDRIVPGFPKNKIEKVYEKIGYKDQLVVDAEPYHLWAIEAPQFVQEELPLDKVGLNVVYTDDLEPYRKMKVRILNGAHTFMVPVAYLKGINTVREAVEDEVVGALVKETIFEEILPTMDFPQAQLDKYANDVLDRFRNPYIKHQLINISLNSIAKFKTRLLPSLLGYIDRKNALPPNILYSLSQVIVFYRGKRGGEEIVLRDDQKIISFFHKQWAQYSNGKKTLAEVVSIILKNEELWGMNLTSLLDLEQHVTRNIEKDLLS